MSQTVPFEIHVWKACVAAYVKSDGNAKHAYREIKHEGEKVSWAVFETMIYDGDETRGLPPVHDMFLKAMKNAVDNLQIDMSEALVDTMKLAQAYKVVLARKIEQMDKDLRLVSGNIGQELHNIHRVEMGTMSAMSGRGRASEEEMSFVEAQEVADEARNALVRSGEDADLANRLKVRDTGGNNVIRIGDRQGR